MEHVAEIRCKVHSIEPLTDVVSRVLLAPSQAMTFKAGQYLRVIMGPEDKRPFSIASAPANDSPYLELHIGAGPDNAYASEVLVKMREQGEVNVDGGHGKAFVRDNLPRPTILVAGGTGFSYTYSILQELLKRNYHEPVFLYWGTRTLDDMYHYEQLMALSEQHTDFTFVPVIEQAPDDWHSKTGWVHKAVMEDFVSLEPYYVYIAGRFEMAGVAREDFHQKGLIAEHLFGDAYEFI